MSACVCGRPTVGEDGHQLLHTCELSALARAAFDANINKLRRLLLAGADVNERETVQGYTPIHFSCLNGSVEAAEILVGFGADLSLVGHDKSTCLHLGTRTGGPDLIEYLLKHGATKIINNVDIRGQTPMHLAAGLGREGIVRLLLDAGADLGLLDKERFSPFHRAVHQAQLGVVKLLLGRAGVEVDSCNVEGRSPLFSASLDGEVEIVRVLIDAGADINKPCNKQTYVQIQCALHIIGGVWRSLL